jgi:hypothetical protein
MDAESRLLLRPEAKANLYPGDHGRLDPDTKEHRHKSSQEPWILRRFVMRRSFLLLALVVIASSTANVGAQVLATGQATIQPSDGPNHPNFRTPVTRQHVIPSTLGSTAGARLSLSLRDATRPNQVCPVPAGPGAIDFGCVAVDWPFFTARATNLIVFETASGSVVRHLHADDTLAPVPEPSDE